MSFTAPLISVVHPTRRVGPSKAFPHGWREAFEEWLAKADDPSRIQYVICVHESRWEEFWKRSPFPCPMPKGAVPFPQRYEVPQAYGFHSLIVVKNTGRDCAVDQCNTAVKAATGMMVSGAQDDLFPPDHWDTLVADTLNVLNEDSYGREIVIRCGSGSVRDATLTIAAFGTRSRCERLGYALNPAFASMFADDYWDWELRRDEKEGLVLVVERQDIQFEHRHPIVQTRAGHESSDPWEKVQADPDYAQQNDAAVYRQGYATFRKLTEGTRVIAVCLPGETFGHWVSSAISRLLRHLDRGPRFIVEDYWAHTSNVYSTRIELADAVLTKGTRPDLVYWQDDDNPVTPEQFECLLADLDAHPELAGVVGWCWCDTGDYEQHSFVMSCGRQGPKLECKFFTLADLEKAIKTGRPAITSDDIAPDAFWSGFPVVLMRASALDTVGWQAFRPMVGDYFRGFTSEDTTFFYRAHQAGLKFAVDLRVKVPHLKVRAIEPYLSEREQKAMLDAMGATLTLTPKAADVDQMSDGPHGMADSLVEVGT